MRRKSFFRLYLVVIVILMGVTTTKSVKAEIITRQYGENVQLTYDSSIRTAVLSGTGSTYDLRFGAENMYLYMEMSPKRIIVENGITRIGNYGLHCGSTTEIVLPNTLKEIGDYCIVGFFKKITIPESVEIIGKEGIRGSFSSIKIPDSVREMGNGALSQCGSLEKAVLPKGLKVISSELFYKSGLKSIEIPESVTTIGKDAFSETKLESVTIPQSVKIIDGYAFANCKNLKTVYISNPNTVIDNAFSGIIDNITIYGVGNSPLEESAKRDGIKFVRTSALSDSAADNKDEEITNVQLSAPSIKSAAIAGAGKIKIVWNAVKNCDGYILYRKTGANGKLKEIAKLEKSKEAYTDKSLKNGKKYYYRLTAVQTVKGKTYTSHSNITGLKAVNTPQKPVLQIKLNKKSKKIDLYWGSYANIKGIEITYRIASKSGAFKKLKVVDETKTGISISNDKILKGYDYQFRIRIYTKLNKSILWSKYSDKKSYRRK